MVARTGPMSGRDFSGLRRDRLPKLRSPVRGDAVASAWPARLAREPGLSLHILITPSASYVGGVFVGPLPEYMAQGVEWAFKIPVR